LTATHWMQCFLLKLVWVTKLSSQKLCSRWVFFFIFYYNKNMYKFWFIKNFQTKMVQNHIFEILFVNLNTNLRI